MIEIFYSEEENNIAEPILKNMEKALEEILRVEKLENIEGEVSLSFVELDEIKEINKTHRGIDKATDVLSFPQFEISEHIPKDRFVSLGDVVICPKKAEEQGKEYGHSYERELVYLFVHSIFHLLGYDHERKDDKIKMRQREEKILETIKLTR